MTNDYGCRGGFQKFGWPAIGHSSALFGLCGLSIHFHYASLEWCDGSTVGTLADPGEGGIQGYALPKTLKVACLPPSTKRKGLKPVSFT